LSGGDIYEGRGPSYQIAMRHAAMLRVEVGSARIDFAAAEGQRDSLRSVNDG
jgi:hypothetical protein